MSNWISVKERLPDDDNEVLCYDQDDNRRFVGVFEDYYEDNNKLWTSSEYLDVDVTHWQPLPKPPEVIE